MVWLNTPGSNSCIGNVLSESQDRGLFFFLFFFFFERSYHDGCDVRRDRFEVVQRRRVRPEDDVEDGEEAAQNDGQTAASSAQQHVLPAARTASIGTCWGRGKQEQNKKRKKNQPIQFVCYLIYWFLTDAPAFFQRPHPIRVQLPEIKTRSTFKPYGTQLSCSPSRWVPTTSFSCRIGCIQSHPAG